MKLCGFVGVFLAFLQVSLAATIEDKYEPMVAFICDRPAMHRSVNGWIPDKGTGCLDTMEDILAYCKTMYPDHNITNVVEASYLVTINDWPLGKSDRQHSHRVRPFRCLVGGFQSDALLVPQHCEFDHRHDQHECEGFSHWNSVADAACSKKGMHLESFGMLLNCKLGKFSGVEYVCCPTEKEIPEAKVLQTQTDDKPDNWLNTHDSIDKDDDDDDDDDNSTKSSSKEATSASSSSEEDVNSADLYEAYLRGQEFPAKYNNEHKRFLAAMDQMKKNQEQKMTKLVQEWQAAKDRIEVLRKTDAKTAETMAKDVTERLQRLYATYEKENAAEKQQLMALHQQHVQAALNERKRDAMDKYMKALEKGDVEKVTRYLRNYIKAEEKDRMHTVTHFQHLRDSNLREAARLQPLVINHLRLSEQRIDQALEMLTRYPDLDMKIKTKIDEFMKRFDSIANSIKDVVLPKVEVEDEETDSEESEEVTEAPKTPAPPAASDSANTEDINIDYNDVETDPVSKPIDENHEEEKAPYIAHHQADNHLVRQGLSESAVTSSQVGSTIGIALGSVSVFVIIVVAIIMLRRNQNKPSVTHGYVEVDPAASPEERHLANMQMNGYENPTYKYFEVQNNPKA